MFIMVYDAAVFSVVAQSCVQVYLMLLFLDELIRQCLPGRVMLQIVDFWIFLVVNSHFFGFGGAPISAAELPTVDRQ